MTRYIEEVRFFNILSWWCPALCGLITSVLVGDYLFLFLESDSSMIYKKCARMPLISDASVSYRLYISVAIILFVFGLAIQLAIFIKQRQLEKNQTVAKSRRILMKHKRNVVSPIGSLLSFLGYNIYVILATVPFPPIVKELHMFAVQIFQVFCLTLIETMFSPTLRKTLLDIILWRRPEYIVSV